MKRSCIGIVVVIALASAMASGAAAQAGEQPDELILLNIDQRLQVFREAADEADLTPAQREKVDAVLGRQRAMAAELLPRTRGPDATTRPMDVIMAAESNAQKEISDDPALKAVVERLAVNELLRLVTPHSSPLFALLLEESALPEHLRFAAEPLASDMRAALRRLEPADWSDTDKGLARQAEVRRIHREFRQALFDLLPPGTERTFIEAAGTEEWQGSIEVLMQLDNHPAIRAGVKPPPDAFISLRSAHVRFAPADGEYQLLAAGQENPVHTVRLKKDDPLGFGAQFGPGPIKAVAGQQFLDLPPDGQLYYWRKAP